MNITDGVYYSLCNMQTFEEDPGQKMEKQKVRKSNKSVKNFDGQIKSVDSNDKKAAESVSWWEIMKLNLPECPYMAVGTVVPTKRKI